MVKDQIWLVLNAEVFKLEGNLIGISIKVSNSLALINEFSPNNNDDDGNHRGEN